MNNNALIAIVAIVLGLAGIWLLADRPADTEDQTDLVATSDFVDSVDRTITGIEPGAGIMSNTETALEAYGLAEAGWTLQQSSAAAMLSSLRDAVESEDPIVATVWEPHAVFAIADIRKLDDPQNIYNNPASTTAFLEANAPQWADAEVASDVIASVVYTGFAEDAPAADAFLENFQVPADTQSQWIYELNIEEREPDAIATDYLQNNRELADS